MSNFPYSLRLTCIFSCVQNYKKTAILLIIFCKHSTAEVLFTSSLFTSDRSVRCAVAVGGCGVYGFHHQLSRLYSTISSYKPAPSPVTNQQHLMLQTSSISRRHLLLTSVVSIPIPVSEIPPILHFRQYRVLASTQVYAPIRYLHVSGSFTTQAENITNAFGVMLRSLMDRGGKSESETRHLRPTAKLECIDA